MEKEKTKKSFSIEPADKVYGRNEINMLSAAKALAEQDILSGKYKNTSGPSEALKAINDYLKVVSSNRYGSQVKSVNDVLKAFKRAGPKKFRGKSDYRKGGMVLSTVDNRKRK